MEQYRKSDQYYVDEYDRLTIKMLRQLDDQAESFDSLRTYDISNPEEFRQLKERTIAQFNYNDTGAIRAKNRDNQIRSRISEDEYKDRMLHTNPAPKNVRCNTCGEQMDLFSHLFKGTSITELVYLFDCPNTHERKRKSVYPNGREWVIPEPQCTYCGGRLKTNSKETIKKIILTDTCEKCGKKEVLEMDRTTEKILPIDEAERKKYCLDFKGRKTIAEELTEIANLPDPMEKKETKYDYSHIQQLNIAKMEQLLTEHIEKAGFVKVQFETPNNDRYLTVGFSTQDPSDRDERSSIKALKKVIEHTLFSTNWKLMTTDISYNLGFLSGRLKGYSEEEDLIKIAKEVDRKKVK